MKTKEQTINRRTVRKFTRMLKRAQTCETAQAKAFVHAGS